MVEQIKQRANQIANSSNKDVIVGVYRNMITLHNNFCGCDYCVILSDYVQMKKCLSAHNKRMNEFDYDFWDSRATISDLIGISKIKTKINELKSEKEVLKKEVSSLFV